MGSQIIERSFELAMHAASVESYEAFETVLSRLRTLDRHNEIPIERYLAIEGIAHARAGHVAQARERLARLLEFDRPLAEETKRLLLSGPEASHESFRQFVEEAIPKPVSPDSDSVPQQPRPLRRPMITGGVVGVVSLVGLFIIFVLPSEPEMVAPPQTIAEPTTNVVSGEPEVEETVPEKTDPVSSSSDLGQYKQMQQVVCKIVLRLKFLQDDGQTIWFSTGIGTGFVVSRDGLILTNRHVVEAGPEYVRDDPDYIEWEFLVVFGNDEEEPLILEAVSIHQSTSVDLAWIRVEHQFEKALAFARTPSPGQNVMAYGFPGVAQDVTEAINEGDTKKRDAERQAKLDSGEEPDLMEWLGKDSLTITVTSGIVSAIRDTEVGLMLQTDTFIHGGNSGGPLVDEQGRVVAMVTLRSAKVESTNFCIASRTIFEELARVPGITWPDSW